MTLLGGKNRGERAVHPFRYPRRREAMTTVYIRITDAVRKKKEKHHPPFVPSAERDLVRKADGP